MALIFPELEIVGVDRSKNSISIANELKERLEVKNVTFVQDVIGDFVDGKFDTVFSSRTVHENIGDKLTRYQYMPFNEQIKIYSELYAEYAEIISNKISKGGRFISFERFDECNTDYYGFLKALSVNNLKTDFSYYEIIEAEESNLISKSKFTITIADKGDDWTEDELFKCWSQIAFSNTSDMTRFTKPQKDYYIQENAGSVRFGYIGYDVKPDAQSVRCVVYDLKDDTSHFLMHQENGKKSQLNIYDNSDETEARMMFRASKRQDRMNGFTMVNIKPGSTY